MNGGVILGQFLSLNGHTVTVFGRERIAKSGASATVYKYKYKYKYTVKYKYKYREPASGDTLGMHSTHAFKFG